MEWGQAERNQGHGWYLGMSESRNCLQNTNNQRLVGAGAGGAAAAAQAGGSAEEHPRQAVARRSREATQLGDPERGSGGRGPWQSGWAAEAQGPRLAWVSRRGERLPHHPRSSEGVSWGPGDRRALGGAAGRQASLRMLPAWGHLLRGSPRLSPGRGSGQGRAGVRQQEEGKSSRAKAAAGRDSGLGASWSPRGP